MAFDQCPCTSRAMSRSGSDFLAQCGDAGNELVSSLRRVHGERLRRRELEGVEALLDATPGLGDELRFAECAEVVAREPQRRRTRSRTGPPSSS